MRRCARRGREGALWLRRRACPGTWEGLHARPRAPSGPLGMDAPKPGSSLLARRGPRPSRDSGLHHPALRSQESEPGPTRRNFRPRTFHRGDSLCLQTPNSEPCETHRPRGGAGRAAGARPPPRRPARPELRAPGWGTARAGRVRICKRTAERFAQLTDQRAAVAPPTWSSEPLQ